MIKIDVRSDIRDITKKLNRLQRSVIPLATAKALTFTAERVQKEQTAMIPKVFSNPTPTTRNAVYKTAATTSKLFSSVYIKDVRGEVKWLLHHIEGGPRLQKGSERRGRMGEWTAAGKNAPRNRYGNITRSTYAKMFADAQLTGRFSGDYSKTKTKAAGGSKLIRYFAGRTRTGKRVIYKRVGGKRSRQVIPMLVETRKPTYKKRWPFFRTGKRQAERIFPELFIKSIRREIAKL